MSRLCAIWLLVVGLLAPTSSAAVADDLPPPEVTWHFSNRLNGGPADFRLAFGPANAYAYLAGDWDGNGIDDIAVRTGRRFDQLDIASGTSRTISFGKPTDEVFVGDWDGNGTDTLMVRRGNVFFASLTGESGDADLMFGYGRAGDEVFVGDWDGNGTDTLAVRRRNVFLVRNSMTSGPATTTFGYGRADDSALIGDWDGNGTDTIMVRRGKEYFARNDLQSGPATTSLGYGAATDTVSVGDWDGNGTDSLAVTRAGVDVPAAPVFAEARIVAHYGSSATHLLGVLGEGTPSQAAESVAARAAQWEGVGLPTVPAAEFIATIANASPGPWGDWSVRVPQSDIRVYIEAMRSVGGMTVLDLQPGQTDFLTQAKEYEALLREPDVHLALDPEWRMAPGQIPARVIGSVDAAEINAVTAWLNELVETNDLPPKLVVLHQFTPFMITNREALAQRDNLSLLVHLDGFGSPEAKISKFNQLRPPPPFGVGFKLFIDEDTRLMGPSEVIDALSPDPVYISYQ